MTLLLALVLTLEQSYGPYARPVNGGDAAVAPARGGALLAWSEANRIHVGMLDARGRLSPEIHVLPTRTERSIAVAPAAASDGFSYFVAWIELESGMQRTMGVDVAFDGTPAGEPQQYGKALAITSNDFALRLVWDGIDYRLWTGEDVPSGVAAANGVVATSSSKRSLLHCGFSWCSWSSDVVWFIGTKEGRHRLAFITGPVSIRPWRDLPLPPTAIAAARDRFVIAWPLDGIIHYLVPGGGSNRVDASADRGVRPGLACDDTRCVIAYGRSEDAHAFAFEIDHLFGPEKLAIAAATERIERAPQVHTLGEGRFLVLYRSDGIDGARLSWRLLMPDPPRRRAMR